MLIIKSNKNKSSNYILRYWEKEFKQIRPYIFSGKRRYYNDNTIEVLKKIKHLLKNEGMTIKGVKKQLNYSNSKLDEIKNKTIIDLSADRGAFVCQSQSLNLFYVLELILT